jgi:hypothetical protein
LVTEPDEADAGAAAAFEHAELDALQRLLRTGTGKGSDQRGNGDTGEDDWTAHEEISG